MSKVTRGTVTAQHEDVLEDLGPQIWSKAWVAVLRDAHQQSLDLRARERRVNLL